MTAIPKQPSLLKALIVLTSLFVIAQVSLLLINAATTPFFDTAVSSSLTSQILHSQIFVLGLLRFLASQFFIYAIFVGLIWYLTVSIGELFSLGMRQTYVFGILLLSVSLICILSANYYFVPHSFFSNLLRKFFLSDTLIDTPIWYAFALTSWIVLTTICLAISHLFFSLAKNQNRGRHLVVLLLAAMMVIINLDFNTAASPTLSGATIKKPNIILIGIDAVRPDFIGFYNKNVTNTPYIDAFLQSGMNFSAAYTPLPRTFPSWTSILSGSHPLHTRARGNNTDLSEIKTDVTLPKALRQAGYETIYSTDDTRFNNTNQSFGFDRVITPPMGLNDFLLGTINDFPLSNLIIPTRMGRFLFPHNYANHGSAITYDPANYLQLLTEGIRQREPKPLFLAVHFTVTHWPFYWFDDKLSQACHEICRYQAGIGEADQQLGNLLNILQANHLLDHAIVVLLSDHGTSMGLPGDRITSKEHYQGNPIFAKKLSIMKYSHAPAYSVDFQHDYGIDTSYGYGGDILSLKQYHTIFALKGYGIDLGKARTLSDRVLLIDIAPTLLDLLNMPPLAHTDGISLKPYLADPTHYIHNQRALFFESSFTLEEIEKEGISVEKVLAKTVKLYRMDPTSGLVFIKKEVEYGMDQNKQRAVMQGDWFLAEYPEASRSELVSTHHAKSHSLKSVTEHPYLVLVNLKTRDWTLELNSAFAKSAPLKSLQDQLYAFYGEEIPHIF